MTPDIDKLHRLVDLVGAKLNALPAIKVGVLDSYQRHRQASETALNELAASEGARWRSQGNGTTLRLAGVVSGSTMGSAMAMQNWLIAANLRITKLEAEARAHVCEHGIRWPWACEECDRAALMEDRP
ncbi:hypothetical protein Xaut_4515 [Xanthobacter versatilis]|uniref:Uncharacterized protein n=1 Tax=Xanthobacter autotrophicus (strain ATCC BAA-1158 / Py2) TaxID=78245 RepID=A7INZ0_XANP2|nr:hypothetical protein Xaut_4515 [Xanthobacter autotrophicus Py2]